VMPQSVLGKMSPTAHIAERSLFVVIKAYLDKSGQEDQELFTIGAVAAICTAPTPASVGITSLF